MLCAVTATDDWPRLGCYVKSQREEVLRVSQRKIAELGGPSTTIQWKVERGDGLSRKRTQTWRQYEHALGWKAGSFDKILAGGEPDSLDSVDPARASLLLDRVLDELGIAGEDAEKVRAVLTALAALTAPGESTRM